MRITLPARLAGPRWWRLARVRGGAAPRGRPDDGWIDDANRVARGQLANYLSTYLPIYLSQKSILLTNGQIVSFGHYVKEQF